MKINNNPLLKVDQNTAAFYRDLASQINLISEQRLAGFYTAGAAAPTTGTWAQGDQVKNTNPVEAGIATAKYVVTGWICTVSGTPGTWLDMRTLTGN